MKPQELIESVENLTHEEYSQEVWLVWFNEVLSDLTPVLYLEEYEEFSITGEKQRDLPGDIYLIHRFVLDTSDNDNNNNNSNNNKEVVLARVDVGQEKESNTYSLWGNKATFFEVKTGTLKLWYYRRPERLTLGSMRADVPSGYEDLLILGAAAKSKAPDRWLEDKNDFTRDYLMRKDQIKLERRRQRNIGNQKISLSGWW